ncbi:MAG: hypothetical protein GPOALKHO_000463 [Sodalis sp.]|nr:MAG: hypothetical protein GPOALKHO_000463 [Sodalis sp.]
MLQGDTARRQQTLQKISLYERMVTQPLIANNEHATVIAVAYKPTDPIFQGNDRLWDLHLANGSLPCSWQFSNAYLQ